MRTFIIFVFSILITNQGITQKLDNVWLLGNGFEQPPQELMPPAGGVTLRFDGKDPIIEYTGNGTGFNWTNASICSDEGELLFYTNGIYVADSTGKVITNGNDLNEWAPYGYLLPQGAIILPYPSRDDHYILINGRFEIRTGGSKPEVVVFEFLHSTIQHDATTDNLEVIDKNQVLSNTDHVYGGITACKHANGRDWWVTVVQYKTNCIEQYLLEPSGIHLYSTQCFPNLTFGSGSLDATYSSDGAYYIISEGIYTDKPKPIIVFDFDRCLGEFQHKESFEIIDTTYSFVSVVSPNSRFLYSITEYFIHQYDLQASNIAASEVIVAEYDGFVDQTYTLFSNAILAPNGKIYVNAVSSSYYLHVINEPDSLGMACDVQQHAVRLPAYNGRTLPNFPNYRLGKLEGSPCDSLITSTANQWEDSQFKVYPNPSSGPISIELDLPEWSRDDISIGLYDVTGKEVYRYLFAQWAYIHTIDPGTLPAGVYLVRLEIDGAVVHTDRVVVN